jgi:hypothetical protein
MKAIVSISLLAMFVSGAPLAFAHDHDGNCKPLMEACKDGKKKGADFKTCMTSLKKNEPVDGVKAPDPAVVEKCAGKATGGDKGEK